jgi:RNA-binding protein
LRTFVAATEDERRVSAALSMFVPSDSIFGTLAKGYFGNEIKILESKIKKKACLIFLRVLMEKLPREERLRLHYEIPSRVDENSNFHMRLDKQAAFKGHVRLTDSKDAIDISVHIASYPSRREEAIRIIGELV